MAGPQIIVSQEDRSRAAAGAARPDPARAWGILSWTGLALALMAGGDILLAWVPPSFENRDWLLSTLATSFSSLPLLALGVAALVAGAVGRGERRMRSVASLVALGTGLGMLVLTIALWAQLPAAFAALSEVDPHVGAAFKRAVLRMSVFGLVFGGALVVASITARRQQPAPAA